MPIFKNLFFEFNKISENNISYGSKKKYNQI